MNDFVLIAVVATACFIGCGTNEANLNEGSTLQQGATTPECYSKIVFVDSTDGLGGKGKGKKVKKGEGVVDSLTFVYINDKLYPAGTYTGRVVYTITEL